MADSDWVTIAVISRVRGNRGEVAAIPLSTPERFEGLTRVVLFGDGLPANGRQLDVESVWFHDRELILAFRGVESISEAEPLRGCEVRLPRAERRQPEPGEFFQDDLVGCEVVEGASGNPLGVVTRFEDAGGTGILVVGDNLLVPFAKSICTLIDVEHKRITVNLPEGLKDLNRP